MTSQINTWYDFALQQMAAESYLEEVDLADANSVREVLQRGNNRPGFAEAGFIRFTDDQALEFVSKFQIIDQWSDNPTPTGTRPTNPGDIGYVAVDGQQILANTGLSATLIRRRDAAGNLTNEYTLAIRSSEYRDVLDGGDRDRDIWGADIAGIVSTGFATAQLASLENYYAYLKQSGKLPAGVVLSVTGYSLGGHLATVFTEIHAQDTDVSLASTYTFNGAGRGTWNQNADDPADILSYYRDVLVNPEASRILATTFSRSGVTDPNYVIARQLAMRGQIFDALSLYSDARHRWAQRAASLRFGLGVLSPLDKGSHDLRNGAASRVTQLFGREYPVALTLVANSGVHGAALGVFAEAQPLFEGISEIVRGAGDFGNAHSIALIADSLALMRAYQTLAPGAIVETLNSLFSLASNKRAESALQKVNAKAEDDALENALDALRRLFLGSGAAPTPYQPGAAGFGDFGARNGFHNNLQALMDSAAFKAAAGKLEIELLTSKSAEELKNSASTSIALRYALKELNPFVLSGDVSIYAQLNTRGELNLFDRVTGEGALTERWLEDRATMLAQQIDINSRNVPNSTIGGVEVWRYSDEAGGAGRTLYVLNSLAANEAAARDLFDRRDQAGQAHRVTFGTDGDPSNDPSIREGGRDDIAGSSLSDRLYGGAGNDLLRGRPGDDYLEGGLGDDVLLGGLGFATPGSTDNDILVGGRGNDVLRGGIGIDKYYFYNSGGADEVFDVREGTTGTERQLGEIYFADVRIAGTLTPVDPDKKSYTFNGPDNNLYRAFYLGDVASATAGRLVLWRDDDGSNVVTLNNFVSGDFDIVLDPNAPQRQYTDKTGTTLSDNGHLNDGPSGSSLASDAAEQKVFGLEGSDHITIAHANSQGFGGVGNDYITNGANDQQLYGDQGRDVLVATAGDDSLYGGLDDDALQGGADKDYLQGDDGNDLLDGGAGEDVISGGEGHDFIFGGGAVFVTITANDWDAFAAGTLDWGAVDAAGNVSLRRLEGVSNIEGDAADVISGGGGDDWVFAGDGNDAISGGLGNDYLVGQVGNDEVSADEGDDSLYGDGAQGDLEGTPQSFAVFTLPPFHGRDVLAGGEGNDFISGDGEADELYGDEGNDTLIGDSNNVVEQYHGADYLDGGDGDDVLLGYGKDDTLFGGAGDDNLGGDSSSIAGNLHADDYLDGEGGADTLHGDGGADTLFGGAGNDTLDGDAGNLAFEFHGDDHLEGGDGNDRLQGGGGSDRLFGGAGNDGLNGDVLGLPAEFAGDDYLDGEAGDDVLEAGLGNDTLTGGSGSDILRGQAGDDVYLLNAGDSEDFLQDREGTNTLRFGAGISSNPFAFQQELDGKVYLGLRYNGVDTIYIEDGLTNTSMLYEFADGKTKTVADWRSSFSQFAFVSGSSAGDTLSGNALAQFYVPGGGNDIVLFGRASGYDRVSGFGQIVGSTQGFDRIRFDAGITLDNLEVSRASGNLNITVRDTGARIQIDGWLGDAANVHTGVQVEFADGTGLNASQLVALALRPTAENDVLLGGAAAETIAGGAGNDNIQAGAGNDVLEGGAGDDALAGGPGADVYRWGFGDGNDVIQDSVGDANIVEFRPGVAPSDVTLTRGSIVVTLNSTGETLTFAGYQEGSGTGSISSRFDITEFRFADGTVWDTSLINENANHASAFADRLEGVFTADTLQGLSGDDALRGFTGDDVLGGGDGNDTLTGDAGGDELDGGAGNDTMDGGAGADLLHGGAGNDTLTGGTGDDIYFVGEGDDFVTEGTSGAPGDGSWDVVRFADGINPSQVSVAHDSLGLRLLVNSGASARLFTFGADPRTHGVEEFRFADGTSWNSEDLIARIAPVPVSLTGADGNDILTGGAGDDVVDGGGGNDTLRGELGDDTLRGGTGLDQLFGGTGNDGLDGGSGNDSLSGDDGADALAGGEGVDSLDGGAGDDALDGGPGNDSLSGGAGNDVYRLAAGGGHDFILDAGALIGLDGLPTSTPGELNVITVDAPLAAADVAVSRTGRDLVVGLVDGSASVKVTGWFARDFGPQGFAARFADETQWDAPTLFAMAGAMTPTEANDALYGTASAETIGGLDGNDTLAGNAGNDVLNGSNGNDLLTGGSGDDILDGGSDDDSLAGGFGNDTYLFGYGSGFDTIEEPFNGSDQRLDQAPAGDRDTVRFAPDVRPTDVEITFDEFNRPMLLVGSADTLTFTSWGNAATGRVEFAQFADGTVWDLGKFSHWGMGTSQGPNFADVVTGSNRHFSPQFGGSAILGMHDELFLGLDFGDSITDLNGHGTIYGGGGNDFFTLGGGDDVISGGAGNDTLGPGSGDNTIHFGRGAGQDSLGLAPFLSSVSLGVTTVALAEDVSPEHLRLRSGINNSLIIEIGGTPDALTVNGAIRAIDGRDQLRLAFSDGTVWGAGEIEARLQAVSVIEGGTGSNNLVGGDGDDVFIGGQGSDTLTGSGGRDTFLFFRGDGADTIIDEAPRIVLGEGIAPSEVTLSGLNFQFGQRDLVLTIAGGGGAITARNWFPSTHAGTIEFADGTVWDSTFVGTRVPFTFVSGSTGTYTGTQGNDSFSLGQTIDTMRGDAGDDALSSDGGNDQLFGGDGNDTLSAGAGNDSVQGDAGNDSLVGGSGDDVLSGGAGDDFLDAGVDALAAGETDADLLDGGDGSDELIARLGNDRLSGGAGSDALDGGAGDDTLDGGSGNDTLIAGAGDDVVEAGAGDDLLDGGAGNDALYGGVGSDTYLFGVGSGRDTLGDFDATGAAIDTIRIGAELAPQGLEIHKSGQEIVLRIAATGDSLAVRSFGREGYGIERVVFEDGTTWDAAQLAGFASAAAGRERADVIFGNASDDALGGFGGDDIIEGGAGADALDGGAGDDVLHGGAGNDTLEGGAGFDHLRGGAGGDTFVVTVGSGSDAIADLEAGDTLALGAGISSADARILRDRENLYLELNATGQFITLENWFADGAQGTVLFADGTRWDGAFLKGAVDAITDGDDLFVGTAQADVIAALGGLDTVYADAGDDIVHGGPASDTLFGEAGNDAVSGDAGFDSLSGGDGDDVLDGGEDDDALLGELGNDSLVGGDGFDSLTGGAGNDVLDGGSGDDTLAAESGDDTLIGGTGDDVLDGGSGSDIYVFNAGFGADTVTEAGATLPQGVDIVRFVGVAPTAVSFKRFPTEYHLEIAGSSDRLVLRDVNLPHQPVAELIEFEDGTVWSTSDISQRTLWHGTQANDVLSGGIFKGLVGLGGNDTLNGGPGDNFLDGGEGNDTLNAAAGNDEVLGGAGVDTLNGGVGDDRLDGGAGNDSLTGSDGNDTYIFGHSYGEDSVFNSDSSAGRSDFIAFTSDVSPVDVSVERVDTHLRIVLNGGADRLRVDKWFTSLDFQLAEARFADGTVWSADELEARIVRAPATEGDDVLIGLSANDAIDGLGGNDRLEGRFGDDVLVGGVGNDTLVGGDGRDTLDGGPGSDTLDGGTGGDVYRFGPGRGFDSIFDLDASASNIDAVELDALPAEVVISRDFSNLYLTFGGGADRLTLLSWFLNDTRRIEEVRLADGTVWDVAALAALASGGSIGPRQGTAGPDNIVGTPGADTIDGLGGNDLIDGQGGNDSVLGGEGNDNLLGGPGNDQLDGGVGNDTLNGGEGNDVYKFAAGSGSDTISESDFAAGNVDTIEIGATPADTTVRRAGGNLEIRLASADTLVVSNWFTSIAQRIEQLRFAGGTTWDAAAIDAAANIGFTYTGSAGSDNISGSDGPDFIEGLAGSDTLSGLGGADVLVGGTGNDNLQGGLGDDIYRYTVGDSVDLVSDFGGSDAVEFSGGTAPSDVTISRLGNDVVLNLASGSLQLSGWLGSAASRIETVQFADGTVWNEGFILSATRFSEAGDFVRGSGGDELLNALGGDDTVYAGRGDDGLSGGFGDDVLGGEEGADTLDGGPGRDILSGDLGDDRYAFGSGSGDDWVIDSGGVDHVVFGPALDPANVVFTRDLSNLYITAGTDKLNLVDWFFRADSRIEIFLFSDGTAFDKAEVRRRIIPVGATSGNDTIFGSDVPNQLLGSFGEDAIYGEGGDDVLDGGTGSDYLLGGDGNDTYHVDDRLDRVTEDSGEGLDTVIATVSHTLSADVENLALAGSAAISATGNAAGNFISGNSGANVLDGAGGDDSLQGGLGNDVYVSRRNEGVDEIIDLDTATGNHDEVRFAAGIAEHDVRVSRVDADIRLRIRGGGEVFLRNWFDPAYKIESVHFADGTVWDAATIELRSTLPENQPPHVEQQIPDQTVFDDAAFSFTVPADAFFDPDPGDALTLGASGMPGWLSFDAASATFSGTPENGDVGFFDISVTATDQEGESASDIFRIEVVNTNDAPVAADDTGAAQEDEATITLAGAVLLANDADIDGDSLAIVAAQSSTAGAAVSVVNGDVVYEVGGLFQSLGHGTSTTDTFTYTVADTAGATGSAAVTVTIIGANDAPLVGRAIADQSAIAGTVFSFTFAADTFADVDHGDLIAYTATLADGAPLPNWLAFDAASRTFTGTAPNGGAGDNVKIRVFATDRFGTSAFDDFELAVAGGGMTIIGTDGNDTLAGTRFEDVIDGRMGFDVMRGGDGDDEYFVDKTCPPKRKGNEGVGNGEDPPPPGHDHNQNDDPGTGPGSPGSQSGHHGHDHDHDHDDDDYHHDHHHHRRNCKVDQVIEYADEGYDIVYASAGYTLPENVEEVRLLGTADLEATGNGADNAIVGNAGDNDLAGEGGDDILAGGRGDDRLNGGTGSDVYVYESDGGGDDVIQETGSETDTLLFGDGVTADMVRLYRRRNDLVVDVAGPHGSVTVEDWFSSSRKRVERIEFADGTVWNVQEEVRRHFHSDDDDLPCRHDEREERWNSHASDAHGDRDDRPRWEGDAVAARLLGPAGFDFEQLAQLLGGVRRTLSSQEIAARWRAIADYAHALSGDVAGREGAPLPGIHPSTAGLLGQTMRFGFEGSTGAPRGQDMLRPLEGLCEGFKEL